LTAVYWCITLIIHMDNKAAIFHINPSSGIPIYRQIIDQIKTSVAMGQLKSGDFLPSVRQVAQELDVNPMTVSKAYSTLVQSQVLESVRGEGVQVKASTADVYEVQKKVNKILPLLEGVVNKAQQLEIPREQFMMLLHKIWEDNQ